MRGEGEVGFPSKVGCFFGSLAGGFCWCFFLMMIFNWNVCRLGSSNKKKAIKEVISKASLDVVLIQESRKMDVGRRLTESIWDCRNKEWVC